MSRNIVATQFYDYVQCPQRVFLDIWGDKSKILPDSEFLKLLIWNGVEHEAEIIKEIKPMEIPEKGNLRSRFQMTKSSMKEKKLWIHNAVLLYENYVGIPDLLHFNKDHYEPIEIKTGIHLKEEYKMQVTFYSYLLEHIQGVLPRMGKIMNIDKKVLEFVTIAELEKYKKIDYSIKEIVFNKIRQQIALGSQCTNCPWSKFCEDEAMKNHDLTLIHDLGRSRKINLMNAGVMKIKDLLDLDTEKIVKNCKGIGHKKLSQLKKQAEVFLKGKMQLISKPNIPTAKNEYYFDLEGSPLSDIIYLFGILETNGKAKYHSFIAKNLKDEGKIWHEFLSFIDKIKSNSIIYHFHHYEKTNIKKLYEKYGGDDKIYDRLTKMMVDLSPIVKNCVILPIISYSLKKIARFIGFEWELKESASGANSIIWYERYLKNKDEKLLDKIKEYNKDDCLATYKIKKWLEKI